LCSEGNASSATSPGIGGRNSLTPRREELIESLALAKAAYGQQQEHLDSLSMLIEGLKGWVRPPNRGASFVDTDVWLN